MTDSIWSKLAATLPPEGVEWRQDGKVTQRDGRWIARFVAYTNAQFVRARLDDVCPGEWNLTLELLPPRVSGDGVEDEACAFKAGLAVAGALREDVGVGRDYKQASTDAFKRAAVRFGIGHELYTDYETIWVEMDGDGKFAKPVEQPAKVWARKGGLLAPEGEHRATPTTQPKPAPASGATATTQKASGTATATIAIPATDFPPACPKCGGKMWDNREGKRNPKSPDAKCRDRSCDGVVWPPRAASAPKLKPGVEDDAEYLERMKQELDATEIPF